MVACRLRGAANQSCYVSAKLVRQGDAHLGGDRKPIRNGSGRVERIWVSSLQDEALGQPMSTLKNTFGLLAPDWQNPSTEYKVRIAENNCFHLPPFNFASFRLNPDQCSFLPIYFLNTNETPSEIMVRLSPLIDPLSVVLSEYVKRNAELLFE